MARNDDGLKSEDMRAALKDALGGRSTRLEQLLSLHGAMPGPRPNLKLAAAFGAELSAATGNVAPLLSKLGEEDAAPDTARVFLPIAAAHGWAGRIRAEREVEAAWAALCELAGDERSPVRLGTLDALVSLAVREGGADTLVERALSWLDQEDRELRFGAAALAIEALGDARVIASLSDTEGLLEYLSRAIDEVADAPRSAERSEGRRRVLFSLPPTLAAVVGAVRTGERGLRWVEAECERAKHPDVRRALSDGIGKLRDEAHAGSAIIEALRKSLQGSAKPLREAARVRPGTGRGKSSRRTR